MAFISLVSIGNSYRMNSFLPTTHTLASIDLRHFTIEILGYSGSALMESLRGGNDNQPSQVLSHELTHWNDLIGTVWGQQYLNSLFEVFDLSMNDNVPENQCYKFVSFFDMQRKCIFPAFYKWLSPNSRSASTTQPWKFQTTCGSFYDSNGIPNPEDPILFANFHDPFSDEKLVRQPINLVSIFELRAFASEIITFLQYAASLPPDLKKVEEHLFQNRVNLEIYNHHLTTYTGAAHFLANYQGFTNPADSYLLGSKIAGVVMNLTVDALEKFQHPPSFDAFGDQRLSGFLKNFDRGYLYASICATYSNVKGKDENEKLENALKLLGLPGLSVIETRYKKEMLNFTISNNLKLSNSVLAILRRKLATMGTALASNQSAHALPLTCYEHITSKHPMPVILSNDCETMQFNPFGMSDLDANDLQTAIHRMEYHTNNILRASRGYDAKMKDYIY